MQYRKFGELDWRVSALGFGAMRLPTVEGEPGTIDEPEATRMLRYAIDHGVNYVDTAWGYHRSQSEPFVGRALGDGYRQRVKVATKLPHWKVEKPEDFDQLLDEQTERLQGPPDFYLIHALGAQSWAKVRDFGVLNWAERAMTAGRFQHLGFSFHDNVDAFKEIVDGYDNWTLAQIQYNYMDENTPGGHAKACSTRRARDWRSSLWSRCAADCWRTCRRSLSRPSGGRQSTPARLQTGPCSGCGISRK
jgi:uncharacterized protein